jgi:hypothetical protein
MPDIAARAEQAGLAPVETAAGASTRQAVEPARPGSSRLLEVSGSSPGGAGHLQSAPVQVVEPREPAWDVRRVGA